METKRLGRTDVEVPAIGMGTWNVAPPDTYAPARLDEGQVIHALRFGIDKGLTHIDTSEGYGNGRAEAMVGQAIKGIDRSRLFIATKVDPGHFGREGVPRALKASLKRLGTDYVDLYMLHWPDETVPIEETMGAMERLTEEGLVRFIGVSNFSVQQTQEGQKALRRQRIVSNQVKYNILDRSIEQDILPFAEKEGITVTAYSPFDTGRLLDYSSQAREAVTSLVNRYHRPPAQIYLNWLIAKKRVIAIPKAVQIEHLRENADAGGWRMEASDYEALGNAFPAGTFPR